MKDIIVKRLKRTFFLIFLTSFSLGSCDKGFEKLNIDPNKVAKLNVDFLFTENLLSAIGLDYKGVGYRNANQVMSGWMQQYANCVIVSGGGDKYNEENGSNDFSDAYPGPIYEVETLIRNLGSPEDINKLSIARIWRVWIYHRLTDLFGDVPYFDAAKGPTEQNYTPKYDDQKAIYMDMLKELDEAAQHLDPAFPSFGSSDLIYNGDVVKWKKFAYSMMLRLGLRLTKVENDTAEKWVKKAIDGGVITEDDDIAYVQYYDGSQVGSRNPVAFQLREGNYGNQQDPYNREGGKMSQKIIDHLKITKDPRLNKIAVVMVKDANSGAYIEDTTITAQKGLLNGTCVAIPSDFVTYSEPNMNTVLNYESPMLILTSSDMNLNLAEAALRGWYNGATVGELYVKATRSAIRQWSLWGSYAAIPNSRIDQYIADNPFEVGNFNNQLEQIQTQRWVSMIFTDEWEIFANWRRTNFPSLEPTNFPGNLTGGTIPRRFIVPRNEELLNRTNFLDAVSRQGNNNSYTARVWWDIP